MTDERIEREILIAAAPERVWPLVAESGLWATDDGSVRGTVASDHTTGWEQCFVALAARAE